MDQQLTLSKNAGKILTSTLAATAAKAFANSGIPDMVVSAIKETINSRISPMVRSMQSTRSKPSGSRTRRGRSGKGTSLSNLNRTGRQSSYFSAKNNPNNHGLKRYDAPTTVGYSYPPTRFGFCGTADGMADHDNIGSLKIRGSCVAGTAAISSWSTAQSNFSHGVAGAVGSATEDRAYIPFDLALLDVRIETIASVFEYFKFRRLRVTYCPLVGSNYGGNITMSLFDDYVNVYSNSSFGIPARTPDNTLAQLTGCSQWTNNGLIWSPFCLEYLDRGAKLYPTNKYSYASEALDDEYPLALVVTGSGMNFNGSPFSNSTLYNLGQIYVEYEVDLYEPSFPVSTSIESRSRKTAEVLSPIPESYEVVEEVRSPLRRPLSSRS